MRVPAHARRCVVFIGIVQNGEFTPKATGFLAHTWEQDLDFQSCYLITAEHVVVALQTEGHDLYCRLNARDGGIKIYKLAQDEWIFHSDEECPTDVAVSRFALDADLLDQDYTPIFPPYYQPRQFGLGDEVFMMGLFRNHHGTERNIPIVRVGNISAMPEEPIRTSYCGFVDAYLVEVRSIAGLSGSPVFVNVQPLASDGQIQATRNLRVRRRSSTGSAFPEHDIPEAVIESSFVGSHRDEERLVWSRYQFLGLMHGHFDVRDMTIDAAVNDIAGGGINSGIGIVVPSGKITDILYADDLREERRRVSANLRAKSTTIVDLAPGTVQLNRPLRLANHPNL